jgi:allantoicase
MYPDGGISRLRLWGYPASANASALDSER